MPLQLRYAFNPTPYPVRASATGANPNVIDLEVLVSNSSQRAITVQKIYLTIPVGDDTAGALSTIANLPQPQYDAPDWQITCSGSTVTIQPAGGASSSILTGALSFVLPQIPVNDQKGIVGITITEFAPAPKVIDSSTYSLIKLPNDFPVTNFYAMPSTLHDLDQPVTLFWDGSDRYVYNLHSDSWHPRDCLHRQECYTARDGRNGVTTPALRDSTTFTLDVIQANPEGSRTIVDSLTVTVPALYPSVSLNSYPLPDAPFAGQPVWLHYLAFNAARCTIQVNGQVIDENAPADRYVDGYPITAQGKPGDEVNVRVTAYSQSGKTRFPWHEELRVIAPYSLPTGPVRAVAASAQTYTALVAGDQALLFDLRSRQVVARIDISEPTAVALSADGRTGILVARQELIPIDLLTRTKGRPINIGTWVTGALSLSADGTLAAVGDGSNVYIVDLIAGEIAGVAEVALAIATSFTPDNKTLLVGQELLGVAYVDVERAQFMTLVYTTPDLARAFGFLPDASTAVVSCYSTIQFVAIATQSVTAEISAPALVPPASVGITPDGKLAAVLAENQLYIVDVHQRKLIGTIPTPENLQSVAIGKDNLAVGCADDGYNLFLFYPSSP